jgi:predicted PurR-regulated permease PerM
MELEISNKTILRIIGLTSAFVGLIYLGTIVWRQIVWLLIAFFFALALEPYVSWLSRFMPKKSRFLALTIVFIFAISLIGFVIAVLTPPLISQISQFVKDFPSYFSNFLHANNLISNYIRQHFNISQIISNQQTFVSQAGSAGGWAVGSFVTFISSVAALFTILTFTFFMVLEGPKLLDGFWEIQPASRLEKRKRLLTEMYKTVNGYVNGNLLTSLIATVSTMILLFILRIPYAVALGVLVGLIDLIPLIGATLAAIIVILVGLVFGGLVKGLIILVFFIIYQQIENNILQPIVNSKTVKISPLITAIAALFGVVLAGFFGALVAVPVAASLQILIKNYLVTHRND